MTCEGRKSLLVDLLSWWRAERVTGRTSRMVMIMVTGDDLCESQWCTPGEEPSAVSARRTAVGISITVTILGWFTVTNDDIIYTPSNNARTSMNNNFLSIHDTLELNRTEVVARILVHWASGPWSQERSSEISFKDIRNRGTLSRKKRETLISKGDSLPGTTSLLNFYWGRVSYIATVLHPYTLSVSDNISDSSNPLSAIIPRVPNLNPFRLNRKQYLKILRMSIVLWWISLGYWILFTIHWGKY